MSWYQGRLIRSMLEKDVLTRDQVDQMYSWIAMEREGSEQLQWEADDLRGRGFERQADQIEDAANGVYDECEKLFELVEEWEETHETLEDINDPACYEADLFGNPIGRS